MKFVVYSDIHYDRYAARCIELKDCINTELAIHAGKFDFSLFCGDRFLKRDPGRRGKNFSGPDVIFGGEKTALRTYWKSRLDEEQPRMAYFGIIKRLSEHRGYGRGEDLFWRRFFGSCASGGNAF